MGATYIKGRWLLASATDYELLKLSLEASIRRHKKQATRVVRHSEVYRAIVVRYETLLLTIPPDAFAKIRRDSALRRQSSGLKGSRQGPLSEDS